MYICMYVCFCWKPLKVAMSDDSLYERILVECSWVHKVI